MSNLIFAALLPLAGTISSSNLAEVNAISYHMAMSNNTSLTSALNRVALVQDGLPVLLLADSIALEREYRLSRRAVEIAALEAGVVPLRYRRNIGTIGLTGQIALLQATAAIVGLGGLGGYVLEGLVRAGLGRIIAIDGDKFEEHNLNRQALSSEANLGRAKALAAVSRAAAVNAAIEVIPQPVRLTRENGPALLGKADVIIDALDNLPDRLMLQQVAEEIGVPLVHGAIAGFLGQVMTVMPGDRGLLALYSNGQAPQRGLEQSAGTPAGTPMLIAAFEVQEAIKIITGKGELLRQCLLLVDCEGGNAERIPLRTEHG